MQLFLFPAIVVVAWFLSRKRPEWVRKVCRFLAFVVFCQLFAIALTGIFREGTVEMHKWIGHGLQITVWLSVPICIGSTLQRNSARRKISAVCQTFLLLGVLGAALLAALTGYLGPSHRENISEESLNRFVILHQIALPAAMATLCLAWLWCFRRDERGES